MTEEGARRHKCHHHKLQSPPGVTGLLEESNGKASLKFNFLWDFTVRIEYLQAKLLTKFLNMKFEKHLLNNCRIRDLSISSKLQYKH